MRTITNPANKSDLVSAAIRTELQTLETEVANTSTGHDHNGVDSNGVLVPTTVNGLTLASMATGFTIAGGTIPKTLTVDVDLVASTLATIGTAEGYTDSVAGGKVNNSGNETIAGIKTFSSFPISPSSDPTTDYQVVNKKYVDTVGSAGTPDATEATKGKMVIASQAKTDAGTDDASALTPLKYATTTKIPAVVATALSGKMEASALSTDGTMADNSNAEVPSQKAVKTYAATFTTIVSENLRNSDDAQVTIVAGAGTFPASYSKVKEILLNEALPATTVKFDLTGTNYAMYAKIYVNGSAVGTERLIYSGSTTYSENLTGLASGALIQIYWRSDYNMCGGNIKNLRLYYDHVVTAIGGKTLATPLADTYAISTTNNS
jgi:hypothetical protein